MKSLEETWKKKRDQEESKRRIKNPLPRDERLLLIQELERRAEEGELSSKDHVRLSRLRKSVYNPTLRQRHFGFKPGRLKKRDQVFLDSMKIIEQIKKDLENEREKRRPKK